MRRKLTQAQKQAAAARLAAARAKKGEPKYSQYNHKLSFKKVRSWIKTNKAKLPLLKKAVRQKERGSIAKLAITEGYISNMESYLRNGIWLDLFYGEDQEHSTGWIKRHVARYDLSD
jgi:CTP:phosphocholine cytidylyltransferase-like protein